MTASLRRAYASTSPADIGFPKLNEPPASRRWLLLRSKRRRSRKAVNKPQAEQKNYALLSDAQIAGIKERLKLSSSQNGLGRRWRPHCAASPAERATRQGNPAVSAAQIDYNSEEVQQLKSAAMPLLFQLREDQKREVRSLARLIGLEKVAAMI